MSAWKNLSHDDDLTLHSGRLWNNSSSIKNFFFVCLNDKKPENNFVEGKEDEEKKRFSVAATIWVECRKAMKREGERERKTVMEGMRMLSYNYARIHAYRQKAPASGEWRYIDDIIIALHLILYFFHIWILFIPLPCSKLHHLLRLFCSLANDEIIGYRLRSSSEGKTMKSIHVCAHEGERLIWVKYLMSNFSIIVVSECSSNFMK